MFVLKTVNEKMYIYWDGERAGDQHGNIVIGLGIVEIFESNSFGVFFNLIKKKINFLQINENYKDILYIILYD